MSIMSGCPAGDVDDSVAEGSVPETDGRVGGGIAAERRRAIARVPLASDDGVGDIDGRDLVVGRRGRAEEPVTLSFVVTTP